MSTEGTTEGVNVGDNPPTTGFRNQIYVITGVQPGPPPMAPVLARVNGVLQHTMNFVALCVGDQLVAYTPALSYPNLQAGGVVGYMPLSNPSTLLFIELPGGISIDDVTGEEGDDLNP